MSATIDILNPNRPKRILMVVANPAVSKTTGWPVGFWWAELTHPYWEFVEKGYEVDLVSPQGGDLKWDAWSDPRDESGYSAYDIISMGFINTPALFEKIKNTRSLDQVNAEDYDAIFLVGGQSPMATFYDDEKLHRFVVDFYESGKATAVVCHATCVLLKTKLSNGKLLVEGKSWTGFANAEEQYADDYVGQRIQPFWIEEEAKCLPDSNFIVNSAFKPHAVRDGHLITGQQQYSGAAAARLVIEALGV